MRLLFRAGTCIAAALALAACEQSKTELMPLEAAANQPVKVAVKEETGLVVPRVTRPGAEIPTEPVELAGRRWQATPTEYSLPTEMVRPVGTADGLELYALAWDEEPFDRLLTPVRPGSWRELLEIR
ncbi:MAG TPA: hypothetical protein VF188_03245 [Longimicrobiales bacterium]